MATGVPWPYPYSERPWASIAEQLDAMAASHPAFRYIAAVPHSVIDLGADAVLAGFTSMHDIAVLPRPVTGPALDPLWISAPWSLRAGSQATSVVAEHVSGSGRRERTERPVAETLPLFWRLVTEKFGIGPFD